MGEVLRTNSLPAVMVRNGHERREPEGGNAPLGRHR